MPEITTRSDHGAARLVVVTGEVIDPPHASRLYDALCQQVHDQAETVQVDLAGVELFGAQAVNALLQAYQDAKCLGCALSVVAASPLVRRMLEIAQVIDLFGLDEG